MGGIPNPYQDDDNRKESVGEVAQRLAVYIQTIVSGFLGIVFTKHEIEATAILVNMVLRAHPWILDIPGVRDEKGTKH